MLVKEVYILYKDLKRFDIKESTYATIMPKIERHILPYFGNDEAEKIDLKKAREWQRHLVEFGLSISFVNDIKIRFSSMLNWAFDEGYISANPLKRLKKLKDPNKLNHKENFWTQNELNKFIQHVDDPLYSLLYYFLFYTGLRRGEFKALTWLDYDFKSGKISINKQMIKLKGEPYKITSPKTVSSYRDVYIHIQLQNKLLKHYHKEKTKANFKMENLIFGGTKPLSNTTLDRRLSFYINKAKIKKITMHGFRHSHASYLIQIVGVDILEVAKRLGHSDIKETLNTYSHLYADKQKSLATDIEKSILEQENNLSNFDILLSKINITINEYLNNNVVSEKEEIKINNIIKVIAQAG